jgi:Mrp family chromosome partitioning ATPase
MDRIRKALDMARQQRELAPEPATMPRAASVPPGGQRARTVLPAQIIYTETQVFQPDLATLEANRIIHPSRRDAVASAFRMLRTQVIQRMEEHGWRSIAILSPGAGDGKTTTAVNLAASLAHDRHHTTLLVDCDLKRPSIADIFGIEPAYGVDDVLRGDARVDQCLHHPESFERLVVMPARAPLDHSSEALAGPQGRALVADLNGRYPERIIVFDLPPVLGSDDALAFLPQVECALVVVAEHATRRDELLRCMELLHKTPIVGTVLNNTTGTGSAYG